MWALLDNLVFKHTVLIYLLTVDLFSSVRIIGSFWNLAPTACFIYSVRGDCDMILEQELVMNCHGHISQKSKSCSSLPNTYVLPRCILYIKTVQTAKWLYPRMISKTRSLSFVNIPIRIKIIKGNGRHCGDSSAYFASSSPQIQDQVREPLKYYFIDLLQKGWKEGAQNSASQIQKN